MRLFVCIAVFIIATASLTINNIYKNISFRSLDRRIYWFTQVQQFLYLSPWTTRVCFLFLSFTLAYMTTRGAINKKERRERERRTVTITRYDVWKWFFFWCSFFSLFLPPMFFGIYIYPLVTQDKRSGRQWWRIGTRPSLLDVYREMHINSCKWTRRLIKSISCSSNDEREHKSSLL